MQASEEPLRLAQGSEAAQQQADLELAAAGSVQARQAVELPRDSAPRHREDLAHKDKHREDSHVAVAVLVQEARRYSPRRVKWVGENVNSQKGKLLAVAARKETQLLRAEVHVHESMNSQRAGQQRSTRRARPPGRRTRT